MMLASLGGPMLADQLFALVPTLIGAAPGQVSRIRANLERVDFANSTGDLMASIQSIPGVGLAVQGANFQTEALLTQDAAGNLQAFSPTGEHLGRFRCDEVTGAVVLESPDFSVTSEARQALDGGIEVFSPTGEPVQAFHSFGEELVAGSAIASIPLLPELAAPISWDSFDVPDFGSSLIADPLAEAAGALGEFGDLADML